jgi:hypothetical protein
MLWICVSLLTMVTREPMGTVTVRGEMPVDVIVSVAAIVPSLPPLEGDDGPSSPPQAAAVRVNAAMTREVRKVISRISLKC